MPLEKRSEEQQREGVWTCINIDGDDEWFKVPAMRPKDLEHIDTMATEKVWRRGVQVEEINKERRNELLADFLIQDWRFVMYEKDAEGNKVWLPPTLENKVELIGGSLERANILITQARLYADNEAARRAAEQEAFQRLGEAPARQPVAQVRGVPEPA